MSLSYLPFISKIGFLNDLNISEITKVKDVIDDKEWHIQPLKKGLDSLKAISLGDPWDVHVPIKHTAHSFLICNSMISSQSGIIRTEYGVILDTMHHTQSHLDLYAVNDFDEVSLSQPIETLSGRWLPLLFAHHDNYYHFLIMNLGRLFQLCDDDLDKIDGILLPKTLTEVGKRAIDLTIQYLFKEKSIQIKRVDWGETFEVQEVLVPWNAVHVGSGYTHSGAINFFHQLSHSIQVEGIEFPKYIYIDRSASSNRSLLNENELIEALQERGFVCIQLEQLTFDEQILLFHHAEYIVGAHGAGLANIVFCQSHTKILEILPHTLLRWCYRQLAMIADLSYDCVVSHSFSDEQNVLPTWAEHSVNIQDILDVLDV